MTSLCPECTSEVADEANVCRSCGERIKGVRCPQCQSMCKEGAAVCKWCRHEFQSTARLVQIKPFAIHAHIVPTLLFRLRLLPQELSFTSEKISVSTPGLFRLWVKEEEIPWHKVAGFKYRDGIFWDTVHIETRGQSATEVPGLRKHEGTLVRELLQKLEE